MPYDGSPPDDAIDLGHGHFAAFYNQQDGHDGPAGIIEHHRTPQGTWCSGRVPFRRTGPGPLWTANSLDPLDLSPSIDCRACGEHGHIRSGRWVPC